MYYGRCTGLLFRAATQHNTSCSDNKYNINLKFRIQKEEGLYYPCSEADLRLCFRICNESQRKDTVLSLFNKAANKKTDINPNGVEIMKTCLEYMGLKK